MRARARTSERASAPISATSFPSCVVQVSRAHVRLSPLFFAFRVDDSRLFRLGAARQALSSILPLQRRKGKIYWSVVPFPSFIGSASPPPSPFLFVGFSCSRTFRFVSFRFVSFRCSTWFRRPCPYIGSLNLVNFDTAAATLPRLIPPRERNQDGSFVLLLSSLLSFSSVSFLSDFALEIDGRPLPILENRSPRPCKRETRRLLARVSTLNFCEFSVALVETLFVNARVCVNVVLSRSLLTEQIFFLSFFFPFVSRTQATPALEKISSGEIAGERLTYEALYY